MQRRRNWKFGGGGAIIFRSAAAPGSTGYRHPCPAAAGIMMRLKEPGIHVMLYCCSSYHGIIRYLFIVSRLPINKQWDRHVGKCKIKMSTLANRKGKLKTSLYNVDLKFVCEMLAVDVVCVLFKFLVVDNRSCNCFSVQAIKARKKRSKAKNRNKLSDIRLISLFCS